MKNLYDSQPFAGSEGNITKQTIKPKNDMITNHINQLGDVFFKYDKLISETRKVPQKRKKSSRAGRFKE